MRRLLLMAAVGISALPPIMTAAQLPSGGEPFLVALGLLALISAAVGATVLLRRPGNRIGLLLSTGALLLTSATASWWWLMRIGLSTTGPLQSVLSWWAIIAILPAVFILFPTVGVFFPDGHLPSRRWRAPYTAAIGTLVAGIALQAIAPAAPDASPDVIRSPFAIDAVPAGFGEVGAVLVIGSVLAGLVMAVGSAVVRYRRSTGVERAQVKWVVAAVVLNAILFPISYFVEIEPDNLLAVLGVVGGCLIPIAVGIAVLRYRLYDIDRLISRTVSWTIVTAGILAVFALLVVGLQAALAEVTQGQTVAVAVSTILAAALFQPALRRVQQAVDRRFDRGRYDAERTAAAFADRLRAGVDLDDLTAELHSTVRRAVRPTIVATWLAHRNPR
jgi:hypothetical protein